jgi:hypothetical protein
MYSATAIMEVLIACGGPFDCIEEPSPASSPHRHDRRWQRAAAPIRREDVIEAAFALPDFAQ